LSEAPADRERNCWHVQLTHDWRAGCHEVAGTVVERDQEGATRQSAGSTEELRELVGMYEVVSDPAQRLDLASEAFGWHAILGEHRVVSEVRDGVITEDAQAVVLGDAASGVHARPVMHGTEGKERPRRERVSRPAIYTPNDHVPRCTDDGPCEPREAQHGAAQEAMDAGAAQLSRKDLRP